MRSRRRNPSAMADGLAWTWADSAGPEGHGRSGRCVAAERKEAVPRLMAGKASVNR